MLLFQKIGQIDSTFRHDGIDLNGSFKAGRGIGVLPFFLENNSKIVGLHILTTVRTALGTLDRVSRLVKVTGMVNCTTDFTQQSQVVNGFSELMIQVFGADAATAARSAVGMGSLPLNVPIEIEAIFEILPE